MAINRKSRTILKEISSYVPQTNKAEIIESRAQHIITSAINLLESIEHSYSADEADILKKRFISSIKGSDPLRFTRMINKITSGEWTCDNGDIDGQ